MRRGLTLLLPLVTLFTGCDVLPRLAWTAEDVCVLEGDRDCDEIRSCSAVNGAPGCDCNDEDANVYPASKDRPAAEEICDNKDNDCSGGKDDDASLPVHYPDNDHDGYGDERFPKRCVGVLVGYVLEGGDCNDNPDDAEAVNIHPNAYEYCNTVDDNCNGIVNGAGELHYALWYPDRDEDGYGDDKSQGVRACDVLQIDGHQARENNLDCDDARSEINPAAAEVLDDGIDNNCDDMSIDSSKPDPDDDGFDYSVDCNESNGEIHPGATESCDGRDNNCDGQVDEATDYTRGLYPDLDRDGYGDDSAESVSITGCDVDGYSDTNTDCNDGISTVYPGAEETCNGINDDCDDSVDESGGPILYRDSDGDGFGDANNSTDQCSPEGYVSSSGDCNDSNANINPNAPETCNSVDDNCNDSTDENPIDPTCELPYDLYVRTLADTAPKPCACMPEYTTIEEAIEDAVDTMVIGIAPGTYEENVSLNGKAITLRGIEGPENTIIDAPGAGSALTFANNETAATRVENLTITGGLNDVGGGILIEGASPTLTGLWIIDNQATIAGGGVGVQGGQPSLNQVVIDGNSAQIGAGLYVEGLANVQVKHGLILSNTAILDGGGIYVRDNSVLSISNVLVVLNSAAECGPEHRGYGGGLYAIELSHLLGTQSTFADNQACTGGGLAFDGSSMAMESSIIASNDASNDANLSAVASNLYLSTSLVWLADEPELVAAERAGSTLAANCIFEGTHCKYSGLIDDSSVLFDWWLVSPQFTIESPYLLQTAVTELESDEVMPGGYGGSGGSTWDLDRDGMKAWYKTTTQWPPLDNPEGWDVCDYAGLECEG